MGLSTAAIVGIVIASVLTVSVVIAVPLAVRGGGDENNVTNAPSASPTNSPTVQPSFEPTFSPTTSPTRLFDDLDEQCVDEVFVSCLNDGSVFFCQGLSGSLPLECLNEEDCQCEPGDIFLGENANAICSYPGTGCPLV